MVAVMGVLALVVWTDQPPRPLPANAPLEQFSEERARPLLRHLTETVGLRVAGTPGQAAAASHLEEVLRSLPGVELDIQDATGVYVQASEADVYTLRNVVARLPGASEEAVLVSAHYDTPTASVGAADDGVAIAAMVEMARALAAGPKPRRSIIFLFNGAEETALLGSAAFVKHPWIKQVRAFVNLEAVGSAGGAIVFQASHDWLLEAYARSAPHPYGTVIGQDLFQSGVIPSDTDFRVYRQEANLPGLDMALFQDGYAYHTALDRMDRLTPGSLQHMGANTLALVRELANAETLEGGPATPGIYYDVLGLTMFSYSHETAMLLAGLAVSLLVGAGVLAWRRGALEGRGLPGSVGLALATLLGAVLAATVGGLVLGNVLERPHGWFAAPWLAGLTFGALALSGACAVQWGWGRLGRRKPVSPGTRWTGALIVWALLLVMMTGLELGTAYLALGWLLPGTLGLALACWRLRAWPAWLLTAWLPGALLTTQVAMLVLELFIPLSGRLLTSFPLDPIIAALVALPVACAAMTGLVPIQAAGVTGRASGVLLFIGLTALAVTALRFPYSPERPKRLVLEHGDRPDRSYLRVRDWDALELSPALASVLSRGRSTVPGDEWEMPAGPTGLPPPRVEVHAGPADAQGTRQVTLRMVPEGATELDLRIPAESLSGWSLSERLPPPDEGTLMAFAFAPPASGWTVTLQLRGSKPVPTKLTWVHGVSSTPELQALRDALPAWTTTAAHCVRSITLEL
jgi:hypothetical protein